MKEIIKSKIGVSDELKLDNDFFASGNYISLFVNAHGCYVTSMSLEGNRMVLDRSLTHSLTGGRGRGMEAQGEYQKIKYHHL